MSLSDALGLFGETENGALSNRHSGSKVLDFYFHAPTFTKTGQLHRTLDLFVPAYREDQTLAMLALFYIRDVRGGQGQRDLFRICLGWLADNDPDMFLRVMPLVPEYGRWDDLTMMVGKLRVAEKRDSDQGLYSYILDQLIADVKSEHPSLLAKWMPSRGGHTSRDSVARTFAIAWMRAFGFNPDNPSDQRHYRRLLRTCRAKIGIVESLMSAGKWDQINFSSVPSQAMRIYRKAFAKHQPERFEQWLADVRAGKQKIHAATLTPLEIVRSYGRIGRVDDINGVDPVLEALWTNLPDYLDGLDVLVVADFSASMSGNPYYTALALALYTAQRNRGPFRNKFISFTDVPDFVQLPEDCTLHTALYTAYSSRVGYNTDLQAVFDLILNQAVRLGVPQSGMPDKVLIISDMQFDEAERSGQLRSTNHEAIVRKYAAAGYKTPTLVYWNVRSANTDSPVTATTNGTIMVAGDNPAIIEKALKVDMSPLDPGPTPYENMLLVLNNERYAPVRAALESE